MTATMTESPSSELPGSVVGRPVRVPYVLLCTSGERWCGKWWTANDRHQLIAHMATRRTHEQGCRGGLIIATA